jgi:hypothetical protein
LKVVISAIPVTDVRPWNRDSVEEMSAMTRIPCLRQIAVLATLLTLTVVPMAGARSVGAPGVEPAGGSWVGTVVRAIEGLFNPAQSARSHRPVQNRKDDPNANKPAGGGCLDPQGHPKPLCL